MPEFSYNQDSLLGERKPSESSAKNLPKASFKTSQNVGATTLLCAILAQSLQVLAQIQISEILFGTRVGYATDHILGI